MKTSDFHYDLPEELIAQHPLKKRDSSRLLVADKDSMQLEHKHFADIIDYLQPDDTLVINDSKVLPARIFGERATGAEVEFLLIKEVEADIWICLCKPGRRAKVGDHFYFPHAHAEILEILSEGERLVQFSYEGVFLEVLEQIGAMPLPPYIHETLEDKERYQTVYAKHIGSAAAPTAGLHFTPELIHQIQEKGVHIAKVTLHVGLGTFRPVKVEDVKQHHMHAEWYELTEEHAKLIKSAKRVVAVGTTSVRTLESIYKKHGEIKADQGETDIFIYPGFQFQVIDLLITNFHLPESTLLMLVSAFASKDIIMNAYQKAIEEKYRFFSFGDAMLIKERDV